MLRTWYFFYFRSTSKTTNIGGVKTLRGVLKSQKPTLSYHPTDVCCLTVDDTQNSCKYSLLEGVGCSTIHSIPQKRVAKSLMRRLSGGNFSGGFFPSKLYPPNKNGVFLKLFLSKLSKRRYLCVLILQPALHLPTTKCVTSSQRSVPKMLERLVSLCLLLKRV